MGLFEINRETCVKDGICADVCPGGLIRFEEGCYPKPVFGADEACIDCGHCVAACPTGSITQREIAVARCAPTQKELQLSTEQLEALLKSRRSIRVYKKKSVSKNDISKLIDIARYAPTAHNSQCVEWLVLGNVEKLRKYSGIVVDWMRWIIETCRKWLYQ